MMETRGLPLLKGGTIYRLKISKIIPNFDKNILIIYRPKFITPSISF